MDEMTQQNAALAEESAASAGSLTSQIQRLNDLVATFRTRQGQTSHASSPVADARRPASPTPAPARRRRLLRSAPPLAQAPRSCEACGKVLCAEAVRRRVLSCAAPRGGRGGQRLEEF